MEGKGGRGEEAKGSSKVITRVEFVKRACGCLRIYTSYRRGAMRNKINTSYSRGAMRNKISHHIIRGAMSNYIYTSYSRGATRITM